MWFAVAEERHPQGVGAAKSLIWCSKLTALQMALAPYERRHDAGNERLGSREIAKPTRG